MIGIILTLVFGSLIFYLYNRLSMTERKMGLVEGVLTDLKIMMDSAPFASGFHPSMEEFEPSHEYLNAISGPVPLQKDEVEEVGTEEEYQQAMENGLKHTNNDGPMSPLRTLQIDESNINSGQLLPAINVTKLSPDLDAMSLKELQGLAKQKGVVVPAGTRRKNLIELLKGNPDTTHLQGTLLAPAELDGPALSGGALLETNSQDVST